MFFHNYNPLNNVALSTVVAVLPSIILLYLLVLHPHQNKEGDRVLGIRAPYAALVAALTAFVIAVFIIGMPVAQAGSAFFYGAAAGVFPLGWAFLALFFFYYTTQAGGGLQIFKDSLISLASDRRLQVLLIAFSFGAFIDGIYGFGLAIAAAGAMLVTLGFRPVQAAVLCLIANMAPTAWSSMTSGTIFLWSKPNFFAFLHHLFPIFTLFVSFFLMAVFVFMEKGRFRDVFDLWPAALVAGFSLSLSQFALTQVNMGVIIDSRLPRIGSGLISFVLTVLFLYIWKPQKNPQYASDSGEIPSYSATEVVRAWLPWGILGIVLCLWSLPGVKAFLDGIFSISLPIPFLNDRVVHVPPIGDGVSAMHAVFPLNLLSSIGSGVILAAVLSGIFILRLNGGQWAESLRQTWVSLKMLILFLAIMFGSSYLARYSGLDAIKGLAYTQTGSFYPFLASLFGAISSLIYGCVAASATCFNAVQERVVAAGQIFRSAFFYMMLLAVLQGLLFL
ncbi:L-lactate permease [Desulfitobacterium chlororespirans]|uniref:L-lactate permease n=1 Tax=Desulfitobacterium chlororespirans DSM 11544 TaxID=1121395 RepID=A0A1M7UQJ3_9FIRM|nr:L-lactate permease [Desulfitobacterium chlororespirans]SHN85313.1 lactate permease [Desulfitobacterium chlororespirans DSM 11544]